MDRRTFLRAGVTASATTGFIYPGNKEIVRDVAKEDNTFYRSGPISGSFFDLIHVNSWDAAYWTDRCRFWKEENWRTLMQDMYGMGIDTVICTATADWARPFFAGYEKTVGLPLQFGCEDPLGICIDEIDKLGMQIFLGAGLRGRVSQVRDYSRMEKPWPDYWFQWNTALAEALVGRYGHRKCFAGLYIPYEVDFKDTEVELYERLIKQYLRPVIGSVKLLASPAFTGLEESQFTQLPDLVERTGIDLLAAQDCGGRDQNIEKALSLVRKHVHALEILQKPLERRGIELWSNVEVFGREWGPDGRPRCIAGPIERIRKQIEMQQSFVKKLICYQYQGIMNRHTTLVNIGHSGTEILYNDYQNYLREWLKSNQK